MSESKTPFGAEFIPNCTVKATGKHFYTDRTFYTNPYGISFFESPEQYGDNPYIAPAYADSPGLLEEILGDIVPPQKITLPPTDGERKIMRQINARYVSKKDETDLMRSKGIQNISCRFEGNLSRQGDSFILQYGVTLPCVICVTDDCASANFPFSPFGELSFQKGKSVMQSLLFSLPSPDLFSPPEEIILDYMVTTPFFSCSFRENATGILELHYTVTVGTTRCETTELLLEITPLPKAEPSPSPKNP